jgi:hypothetical protein
MVLRSLLMVSSLGEVGSSLPLHATTAVTAAVTSAIFRRVFLIRTIYPARERVTGVLGVLRGVVRGVNRARRITHTCQVWVTGELLARDVLSHDIPQKAVYVPPLSEFGYGWADG